MRIPSNLRFGKNKRGFTLVELMIVVAIIGVLAALAIYGVRKYLLNAKTAEARSAIGRIAKDASSAYDRERMAAAVMALGASLQSGKELCPSSTLVPALTTAIQGKKYQSSPADWAGAGWECLRFTMQDPQYFQYSYSATNTAAVTGTFDAIANGDLDGDTTLSTYKLSGAVKSVNGENVLTLAPSIGETNPEE